jgi:6-phosphofructokinase 2
MQHDATLVLTVTPNPSLDLLFEAGCLVWDDANRMPDPRRRAGGQGINVTRAVRRLGGTSAAVALLGGRTGGEVSEALRSERAPLRVVEADAETRTFVAARELDTGRSMLYNARGPARSAHDADRLAAAVAQEIASLRPLWLACCGSVPAGFPADFYAQLASSARRAGCRVVVDCDGEPLRLAVAAGCDLLVPNRHEAERLLGRPVPDAHEAAAAARELGKRADIVAITLGSDGAVLSDHTECWHARVPPLSGGSAVGAGDAFLAGLIVALQTGDGLAGILRRAAAAGAAALLSRGSDLLDPDDARALESEVELRPL